MMYPPSLGNDPFDVEALRGQASELADLAKRPSTRPPRHRRGELFLKGPIPWAWLEKAFPLAGKSLHVALLLWREAGCRLARTVCINLSGSLPQGLNRQSARRGLAELESAGLVTIHRRPGRKIQVTLNDLPGNTEQAYRP